MDSHQSSDGVTPGASELQIENQRRAMWRAAANTLRRSQLGDIAAMCLEAAMPLAMVASQLLYAGGPILGARATSIARFLESDEAISDLAHYLAVGDDDPSCVRRASDD